MEYDTAYQECFSSDFSDNKETTSLMSNMFLYFVLRPIMGLLNWSSQVGCFVVFR